jgi:hypothetical protein
MITDNNSSVYHYVYHYVPQTRSTHVYLQSSHTAQRAVAAAIVAIASIAGSFQLATLHSSCSSSSNSLKHHHHSDECNAALAAALTSSSCCVRCVNTQHTGIRFCFGYFIEARGNRRGVIRGLYHYYHYWYYHCLACTMCSTSLLCVRGSEGALVENSR